MVHGYPRQNGAYFDWTLVAQKFTARVLPTIKDPPIAFISSSIARYVSGSVRKKYHHWILRCCQILKFDFLKQLLTKEELDSRVSVLFRFLIIITFFLGDVRFEKYRYGTNLGRCEDKIAIF